jgi:nicotinamide-nucleotide amidase
MHRASQSGGDGARDGKKKTPFYFAAGVPYEMKYLVENEIIPKVVKNTNGRTLSTKQFLLRTRSLISERIEAWENSLRILKLAYLPSPEKFVCISRGTRDYWKCYRRICGSLNLIINDIVGFEEEETIEFLVGICKKKGKPYS